MNRLQLTLLFFVVLLSGTLTARAADETNGDNRPLYYDSGSEDKTKGTELTESHALVGPHCMVNRVFNTVSVGTMTHNLDNLTDEDLSNAASFPSLVNVGVAYSPLVSVRDMSRRYAAGTTAGYRVVYSSGSSVVKLDLGNAFALKFFLNGKPVKDKNGNEAAAVPAKASSSVTGVELSLIQIPGSNSMCFDVQAAAPAEFDEVELVSIKGLSADVISNIQLKYAYAGKPKTYTITNGGAKSADDLSGGKFPNLANYAADEGRKLDENEPISTDDIISGDVLDENLDNGKVYGVLLGLGWIGHAKLITHPTDGKELFPAGSTVGFKMSGLSLLSLKIGYTVVITTRDLRGKKVEEKTAGSSVLGLNVIKGGSDEGTVEFETTKPFSTFSVNVYGVAVNLGGSQIKYGFVKAAPTKDHHCPIRISADMNICDSRHSVSLNHNDSIPVTWSVESVKKVVENTETKISDSEVKIDKNGNVSNMNDNLSAEEVAKGGKIVYTFMATAADGCYETVNVNRGVVQTSDLVNCVTPIKKNSQDLVNNKEVEVGFADNSHGGGSLVSISKISNHDNILDGKQDTYGTLVEGLKLADNVEVIGVKTQNGTSFRNLLQKNERNDSVRVGFVAEITSTGLTLKLLHGFAIKCYNGGKEVCNRIVSQSDVLGLGLAGSNKVQKINLAITVPKDVDFDEITLWSGGLLDLSVSKLNIYYPFIESGDSAKVAACENPLGCDYVTVSNNNTNASILTGGASIDHDNTGNFGVVDAGSFMENLSNVVDDDPTTACTFGGVAKVGGGYRVAINLGRTLDYRHQLGLIMDKPDDKVLQVQAGAWMTIETYRNGKPTGDKKTDWKVLGADVLTMNEKQDVFLMNPKQEYDEVVITMAAVANVLKWEKIYGIVLESDVDGDGIPDCKDESSCTSTISNIQTKEICQNEQLRVTWTGKSGTKFKISLPEQGVNMADVSVVPGYNEDVTYEFDYPSNDDWKAIQNGTKKPVILHPKKCKVIIYDENGNRIDAANYYVHPLITKWRTNAIDTDWGNENNWVSGTPYLCTDVIIPSGAQKWPVLTAKGTNGCNEIHFMPHAAIENVFRLNYDSAWVDLGVQKGQTLYMAPLQQTFSGDFYVIKNDTLSDYSAFKPLTAELAPENRIYPFVYQRMWKNAGLKNMNTNGETDAGVITTSGNYVTWSQNFNILDTNYSLAYDTSKKYLTASCFSLASGYNDGTEKEDAIRLPKYGNRTYYYYNNLGDKVDGRSASVTHTVNAYRFGYEANSSLMTDFKTDDFTSRYGKRKIFNLPDNGDGSFTIHYSHDAVTGTQVDDGIFLVGNPMMSHLVISKFITSTVNNSVKSLSTWNGQTANTIVIIDGQPIGTTDNATTIEPAHAFFVQAQQTTNNAYLTTLDLTYSTAMFDPTAPETTGNAKARFASTDPFAALRVLASADSVKAGTLLLQGRDNKAATILDSEVQPKLAVFTVSNGKAYDVQPVNGDIISLGIIAKDSVKVSFQTIGNFDLSEWTLRDLKTGFSYPLTEPVMLDADGTTIGRYVLTRGNATDVKEALLSGGLQLNVADGLATVTSHEADLTSAAVYDEAGRLIDRVQLNNERQAVLHVAAGVNIVKVCRAGKADKTYKVMGR